MSVSVKAKDIAITRTGDFMLSIPNGTNTDGIVQVNNLENDLLMQKIALRLSSRNNDWEIPVAFNINLDSFLGMPLDYSLVDKIVQRIIYIFTYDNLIEPGDIQVSNKVINKSECYISMIIKPRNNPSFTKGLLLSYDSNSNLLTPTVIDYIER